MNHEIRKVPVAVRVDVLDFNGNPPATITPLSGGESRQGLMPFDMAEMLDESETGYCWAWDTGETFEIIDFMSQGDIDAVHAEGML